MITETFMEPPRGGPRPDGCTSDTTRRRPTGEAHRAAGCTPPPRGEVGVAAMRQLLARRGRTRGLCKAVAASGGAGPKCCNALQAGRRGCQEFRGIEPWHGTWTAVGHAPTARAP